MKFADKNVLIHEKVQIEVTDCCNLHCFYCPIEQMSHKYMSYELFCSIVDKYKEPTNFLLQGTGESLLHNDFFRMLTYVKSKGHKVKLITNGTVEVTEDILNNLDQIMFSADEFESEKKGKPLKNILKNIEKAIYIARKKVSIRSVDYGQDFSKLIKYANKKKIKIFSQKLQSKPSYQTKYKTDIPKETKFSCVYLQNYWLDYYFVSGKKVPCCYMINEQNALSREDVLNCFARKEIPECCLGCEHLSSTGRDPQVYLNYKGSLVDKIKKLIRFFN